MFQRQRDEDTPHVIQLSVARADPALPQPGAPLPFLVTVHEEGTGLSWRRAVTLSPSDRRDLLDGAQRLDRLGRDGTGATEEPRELAVATGRALFEAFLGADGARYLGRVKPTAYLVDVDETVMDLPWELLSRDGELLAEQAPLGRLVGTQTLPRPGRDALDEDKVVQILAVSNPTGDLTSSEEEVGAIEALAGEWDGYTVEVTTLDGRDATASHLSNLVSEKPFDILHFAGHASYDADAPESAALRLADGPFDAERVLDLPFRKPPFFVFNSACESARAAGGLRLVSPTQRSNGLAAAFLTCGAEAYAGYVWPVSDRGAALFAGTFYRALFRRENVGLAFQDARLRARDELELIGDLSGLAAVLYGDAGAAHRRDLVTRA